MDTLSTAYSRRDASLCIGAILNQVNRNTEIGDCILSPISPPVFKFDLQRMMNPAVRIDMKAENEEIVLEILYSY